MAMAWVVERLQLTSNPFTPLEDAAIDHLLQIGAALASVAVIAWMIDRRLEDALTAEGLAWRRNRSVA